MKTKNATRTFVPENPSDVESGLDNKKEIDPYGLIRMAIVFALLSVAGMIYVVVC